MPRYQDDRCGMKGKQLICPRSHCYITVVVKMSQHATKTLSCCCCFLISIPQSPLILFRTCSGVNLKAFLTRRKFLNKINTSSEYRTECIRTIWICSRLTLNADGEFLHERENLQVQSYRNQVAKGDEALHHS